MQRLDAIKVIAGLVTAEDLFTTSIGGTWDDWWNCKPANNTFFMSILGSVVPTALGLALSLPHRRIIALETDGSALMNTGILCTLGAQRPPNLTVVVMDNGIYENIGGPLTLTSKNTDLAKMAEGAGCLNSRTVSTIEEFSSAFEQALTDSAMAYLVAKIQPGGSHWEWQQRKPTDGLEDKYNFLRYMEKLEKRSIHPGAAHN
jgi:thiamine pyrophosphate-dependent acetolactate synthase large subunit-like protein